MTEHEGPAPKREQKDVHFRTIAVSLGALALLLGVAHLSTFAILDVIHRRMYTLPRRLYPPPPSPRLQTDPARDLASLRKEENRTLGTYGWVDRRSGVVRVPIEVAMERVLRRGLPVRKNPKEEGS